MLFDDASRMKVNVGSVFVWKWMPDLHLDLVGFSEACPDVPGEIIVASQARKRRRRLMLNLSRQRLRPKTFDNE